MSEMLTHPIGVDFLPWSKPTYIIHTQQGFIRAESPARTYPTERMKRYAKESPPKQNGPRKITQRHEYRQEKYTKYYLFVKKTGKIKDQIRVKTDKGPKTIKKQTMVEVECRTQFSTKVETPITLITSSWRTGWQKKSAGELKNLRSTSYQVS